jgi:hypothetical protein
MNVLYCITTLTERNRLEAWFAKYDNSDSESNNVNYLLCDVSWS